MIYTIKSESKPLNFEWIQFFLTWFKIPMKLILINLKWLIAMISYYKLALWIKCKSKDDSTEDLLSPLLYDFKSNYDKKYKSAIS